MSAQRLSHLDTSSVPGHVGDLLPIDPHRQRHRDTWIYRSRGACCSTIGPCRIPSWHNGTLAESFTRIRWTWNSLLSYPNCFNGSTVGQNSPLPHVKTRSVSLHHAFTELTFIKSTICTIVGSRPGKLERTKHPVTENHICVYHLHGLSLGYFPEFRTHAGLLVWTGLPKSLKIGWVDKIMLKAFTVCYVQTNVVVWYIFTHIHMYIYTIHTRGFTHQYVYIIQICMRICIYIYIDPYIHNMYVICLIHQYPLSSPTWIEGWKNWWQIWRTQPFAKGYSLISQLNQLLKRTLR